MHHCGIPRASIRHIYFDDQNQMKTLCDSPLPTIIGPGPHAPADVTPTLELTKKLMGHTSILGICLGHQVLGAINGARIVKAKNPWHGSRQTIHLRRESPLFHNVESPTAHVGVYNSLAIAFDSDKSSNEVAAVNDDQEIMAMCYHIESKRLATWSVQFHPESFLTDAVGFTVGRSWLKHCQ